MNADRALFQKQFNYLCRKTNKDLIYLAIRPNWDLTLKQIKFITKQIIRSIGKVYEINHSHEYPIFLGVMEVSPTITKNHDIVKELGLHSHIFIHRKLINGEHMQKEHLIDIAFKTFFKNGIIADVLCYADNDFYRLKRFGRYHLKQLPQLNKDFIVTNIKKPKRINI